MWNMNRNPGVQDLLYCSLHCYRHMPILRFADILLLILTCRPRSTTRSDHQPGHVPRTIPATIFDISAPNRATLWDLTPTAQSPAGGRSCSPISRTESGRGSCVSEATTINRFPILLVDTAAATIFSCVASGSTLEPARGNRKWLDRLQRTIGSATGSV